MRTRLRKEVARVPPFPFAVFLIQRNSARVTKKLSSPIPHNQLGYANPKYGSTKSGHLFDFGVIIEFPDKNRPHLLLATATGATAWKESIYDVILLEYLATGCYRCYRCYSSQGDWSSTMTSFFWSALLLVCHRCYRCYSSQGV